VGSKSAGLYRYRVELTFKDGTYDALIYGIRSETNKSHYYKQGYDFGLVLFADQIDQEVENA